MESMRNTPLLALFVGLTFAGCKPSDSNYTVSVLRAGDPNSVCQPLPQSEVEPDLSHARCDMAIPKSKAKIPMICKGSPDVMITCEPAIKAQADALRADMERAKSQPAAPAPVQNVEPTLEKSE